MKRQEAWAVSAFGVASPPVVRYSFATINGAHCGLDGRGRLLDLARILAYVTGTVDQELLARNEYLVTENRIQKAQLKGRLKLSDAERATLGEIAHRVGRKVLAEVATVARPDTILAWYRKLVACKFDGSQERWVRSVKEECLSKIILFGERSLRRALCEYVEHYHAERNHQGKDNVLLFPPNTDIHREGAVQCRERLGGLLRYYHQEAE
jgi:hypothetical protein